MLLLNCILYILYSTSIAYGKCYCDLSADSVDDSVRSHIALFQRFRFSFSRRALVATQPRLWAKR